MKILSESRGGKKESNFIIIITFCAAEISNFPNLGFCVLNQKLESSTASGWFSPNKQYFYFSFICKIFTFFIEP